MSMQKQCPQCGSASPLSAEFCAQCGHVYRTQFLPANQTRVLPAASPPTEIIGAQSVGARDRVSPYTERRPLAAVRSDQIMLRPGTHSALGAGILSALFFNCGGQFYNRQPGKAILFGLLYVALGFLWLVALALGDSSETHQAMAGFLLLLLIPASSLLWIASVLDAGLVGAKLARGEPVSPWTFF